MLTTLSTLRVASSRLIPDLLVSSTLQPGSPWASSELPCFFRPFPLALPPRPWDISVSTLGGGAPRPPGRDRMLVSALHLSLPRPPPPLPLSVASSKDALSVSCTPGVRLVEGEESERAGTWLGGRKIISARRLCLRLKPYLHFKSGDRPCCHLRDAIDQPACHLMSADTGALMKLIEQPMIDNCSACQCRVSPSRPDVHTVSSWSPSTQTPTCSQDPCCLE